MQKHSKELTQAEIHKYFSYEPITGVLYRKDKFNPQPITSAYVSVKYHLYSTARIIFCYMEGYMPDTLVMRIDKDVTNNRWDNFTIAKRKLNKLNKNLVLVKSAQKRGSEVSGTEMLARFRYDDDTKSLWFIKPDGEEILSTKQTITIRGRSYPRHYIIKRVKYLRFAEQMQSGFIPPTQTINQNIQHDAKPITSPKIDVDKILRNIGG